MGRTLWVRYKSGAEDDWEIHSAMDLKELSNRLAEGLVSPGRAIAVATMPDDATEPSPASDYGRLWLRMDEVACFHIDTLMDERSAAGLFAEIQSLEVKE